MFWILRRTGAVNLFNSINNNYSSKSGGSSGSSYTINSEKNQSRPPRKAYGRLSVESDDHRYSNSNETIDEDDCDLFNNHNIDTRLKLGGGTNSHSSSNICQNHNNNNNINNNNDEDCVQADDKKFLDDNMLPRLQTVTLSDDDDYDEALTCNVCDRAFSTFRALSSHQQKKRHFGCSGCDSLFSSLMLLEHHKEEFEHWSDSEEVRIGRMPCCRRNRRMDDDDFYDTDTGTSDAESEDMERLL